MSAFTPDAPTAERIQAIAESGLQPDAALEWGFLRTVAAPAATEIWHAVVIAARVPAEDGEFAVGLAPGPMAASVPPLAFGAGSCAPHEQRSFGRTLLPC